MRHSRLLASVAALSVSAMCASSAFAQRIIVFGDSLSDNGNLPAGSAPPAPPYGVGPNGAYRFSSGTNWVDQLYGPAARPLAGGVPNPAVVNGGNVDLAFGGARTDTALNPFNAAATTPSIPFQISTFRQLGGVIGANDTVTLWGGANNIFQYIVPVNPALANPATASAAIAGNSISAANSELGSVNALIGAGAKKIVVLNLPGFGSLPSYIAAGQSSTADFASSTFNATLAAGLNATAASAPGVNIIQADIAAAFRVVIANASTFGFTNVTQPCLNSTTGAVCANKNAFLFWDSVHPTQAGYALVAQYVGLLTNTAPALQQVARLGETGLLANELITNQVFDRMSAFISGTYADKNGPFAEIIGSYSTLDGSNGTPGLTLQLGGVRAGIDKKSGATLFGGSLSILEGAVSTGSLKSDVSSFRGDLYGTALFGNTYVSADAGFSRLNYTGLRRQTSFATVATSGETNGFVATAGAEAGFVQQIGALTIIPSVRATYFHTQIDAYDETSELLAMSFAQRQINQVLLGGKVRVVTPVRGFGMASTAFGEIGYEGFVSTNGGDVTSTLVGNTALPTTVKPGDPNGPGIIGKVGLSSQVTEGTFLDFQYGLSLHDGGGESHSGDIRLKSTF